MLSPFQNCLRLRAASSGPLATGCSPASPSVFPSTTYQMTPSAIPTAVAPNPQCHEVVGENPHAESVCLNHSSWASEAVTSGASKAPTLIAM